MNAPPPLRTRAFRAAGVAVAWGVGLAPLGLGTARCAMAETFGISCPGCGMTRAIRLLEHGDVAGSLRMHPLAVPNAIASALVMIATVWITAREGTPLALLRPRAGRVVVAAFVAVQIAMIGVWIARLCGALGGPVPV